MILTKARAVGAFKHMFRQQGCTADEGLFKLSPSKVCGGKNWPTTWSSLDDGMLLTGIMRHGYGSWEVIRRNPALGLYSKICPAARHQMISQMSMNYRQLARRTDLLLKMLYAEYLETTNGYGAPYGTGNRTHIGTHTHIHARTHARMHTPTHTHTHTHTHTRARALGPRGLFFHKSASRRSSTAVCCHRLAQTGAPAQGSEHGHSELQDAVGA